jgi:hypothetical protein
MYFSRIGEDDLVRMRARHQIPDDVVLCIPSLDERACYPTYDDVAFYEVDFQCFPMQPFMRELLDFLSLAPGQVALNSWRTIIACMVMWRVSSQRMDSITVEEFLYCFKLS